MNREIKFQFIVDNNELTKPYTIEEILNKSEEEILEEMEICDCVLTESVNHCEGSCLKYENSKITGKRQFTGLKDKNGKEIYEGDIYRETEEHEHGDEVTYFVCVYIKELARFAWLSTSEKFDYETLTDLEDFLNEDYSMDVEDCKKINVIGNALDRPELLNS